jgi:hypothetical protein
MIELPSPPTDVTVEELAFSNSSPIDVLGDRDGTATLVLGIVNDSATVQVLFSAVNEAINASVSIPIGAYTVLTISKATRYMTLFANGADASVAWYVV